LSESKYIEPKKSRISINLSSIVIGVCIGFILCFLSIVLYYIIKFEFICKFYDLIAKKNFNFNRFDHQNTNETNEIDDNENDWAKTKSRTNVVRFARSNQDSIGFNNLIGDDLNSNA
jgi:hypothetical protein